MIYRGREDRGAAVLELAGHLAGGRSNGMGTTSVVATRAKRRTEQRELRLYQALGFFLCLPVVTTGRAIDLLRGRQSIPRCSIIEETSAKVGAMLGFVFMA